MKLPLLIAALFTVACPVWAVEPTDWPYCATCDIDNMMGDSGSGGTGSLVGLGKTTGLVLTCAHTFMNDEMTVRTIGQVTCKFPNGKAYRATLLGIDPKNDLSAWQIKRPEGIKPLPVAELDGKDAPFTSIGFPALGNFRYHSGKLTRIYSDREAVIAGRTYSGFSGGPLINKDGEQVGVVVRTGPSYPNGQGPPPTYTVAVCNSALLPFIHRWMKAAK